MLIDENLKPWLIEVNASPSLARDHPLDVQIKNALIADTLSLVAPPYFDRAVWREMLRWRVAERSGERGGVRGGAQPSLAAELCALLHGTTPRAHGQLPPHECVGLYERIAPSTSWDRLSAGRQSVHGAGGGAGSSVIGKSVGGGGGKSAGGGPVLGAQMSLRAGRGELAAKYL